MSRTDFEAAYIERYGHRPRGWNDNFQVYQDAHANGAWFGWQAREVVMPPLMPLEPFVTIDRGSKNFKAGWNAYAQEFARRLNKQVREVVMPSAEVLADLFVGCPLPKTVRVDQCALDPEYPHRFGTNLLTWGEAKLMFDEMLARLNGKEVGRG